MRPACGDGSPGDTRWHAALTVIVRPPAVARPSRAHAARVMKARGDGSPGDVRRHDGLTVRVISPAVASAASAHAARVHIARRNGGPGDARGHVGRRIRVKLSSPIVVATPPAVASACLAHAARVFEARGDGGPGDTRWHAGPIVALGRVICWVKGAIVPPAVAHAARGHAARVFPACRDETLRGRGGQRRCGCPRRVRPRRTGGAAAHPLAALRRTVQAILTTAVAACRALRQRLTVGEDEAASPTTS